MQEKNNITILFSSSLLSKNTRKEGAGQRFAPAFSLTGPRSARSAFTLIELLVVVLIIGILAAIAVPQYQKAVEKSESTAILPLLQSLKEDAKLYYITNGEYPTKFEQFTVTLPDSFNGQTKGYKGTTDTKSNQKWSFQIWALQPKERMLIIATRISGPYTGGGFFFNSALDVVHCLEHHNNFGIKNLLPKGNYCEKLFNATLKKEDDGFRIYNMP